MYNSEQTFCLSLFLLKGHQPSSTGPFLDVLIFPFLIHTQGMTPLLYSCSGVLGYWLQRLDSQAVYLQDNVKFRKTHSIHGQKGTISLIGIKASDFQRLSPLSELGTTCLILSHCPVLEWNFFLLSLLRGIYANKLSAWDCNSFINLNSGSWNLGLPIYPYWNNLLRIMNSFAILASLWGNGTSECFARLVSLLV